MIENMQAGSVIYDLAAIQEGNTIHEVIKLLIKMGQIKESNILNKLPVSASNLYAKIFLILLITYLIKIIKNKY